MPFPVSKQGEVRMDVLIQVDATILVAALHRGLDSERPRGIVAVGNKSISPVDCCQGDSAIGIYSSLYPREA